MGSFSLIVIYLHGDYSNKLSYARRLLEYLNINDDYIISNDELLNNYFNQEAVIIEDNFKLTGLLNMDILLSNTTTSKKTITPVTRILNRAKIIIYTTDKPPKQSIHPLNTPSALNLLDYIVELRKPHIKPCETIIEAFEPNFTVSVTNTDIIKNNIKVYENDRTKPKHLTIKEKFFVRTYVLEILEPLSYYTKINSKVRGHQLKPEEDIVLYVLSHIYKIPYRELAKITHLSEKKVQVGIEKVGKEINARHILIS